MKIGIVSIVVIAIVIATIYFNINKRITDMLTIALLTYSLFVQIIFTDNTLIKKIQFGIMEIETFQKQAETVTQEALNKFKEEIQRESDNQIVDLRQRIESIENLQVMLSNVKQRIDP
jgi:hypothetical protein